MRDLNTTDKLQPEAERPFQPVGLVILGTLLVALGVLLLLRIFFGVTSAIRDPQSVGQIVDTWEREVAGERPLVEFPTSFRLVTTGDWPSAESVAPPQIVANGEIRLNLARPGMIAVLLILLAILVQIAVQLTSAGIKILTAGPQRDVLKQIVTELQRSLSMRGKRDDNSE